MIHLWKWLTRCRHKHTEFRHKPNAERERLRNGRLKLYPAEIWCLDCGERIS